MSFWRTYIRNLVVMALIFGAVAIFAAIFYPDTLSVFAGVGQIYSGFNLWPIIILGLLVVALPRRRR